MEKVEVVSLEEATYTENVFTDMPAHGTVVGQVTPEEIAEYNEMDLSQDAIQYAGSGNANYVPQMMVILENKRKWWLNVLNRHNLPWAWPVSFDVITGKLYINNK